MAIKKIGSLPVADSERPISVPKMPSESTASGNNTEVIEAGTKPDIPHTDSSIDKELGLLQDLKNSQFKIQGSPAIKHLSGTKTEVIYFNQVSPKVDTDAVNVSSIDGVNDTKFNRIDNLIINIDSELSSSYTVDEGMPKNEITSTGLLFPGFRPYPGDLFYVTEKIGKRVCYKVTSVEPITSLEETGFKIEFIKHYDQGSPENLTSRVQEYYVFNFEAVGTGNTVLLQRKVYDTYVKLKECFELVSEEYLRRFYDKSKDIIRLKIKEESDLSLTGIYGGYKPPEKYKEVFDPYIVKFLQNNLLRNSLVYRGLTVYPVTPPTTNDNFDNAFHNTIYNAVIRRKPSLIKNRYPTVLYFETYNSIRNLIYRGMYYIDYTENRSEKYVDIYPENFVEKVCLNTKYDKQHDKLENLKYNWLIEFINNKKYQVSISDAEAFIEDVDIIPDNEFFGIGPILLYALSITQDYILKKNY